MNLLTFDDVAKLVKKTSRGIRLDIAAGRFGPDILHLGRCVRVSADELRDWILAGCPRRADWLELRDRTREAVQR